MTSGTGWIKLHRQVMENELYFTERFSKMQAWIDLLLLANHKQRTIFIRGVEIQLNTGELAYSMQSLGKRWQWNKRTVKHFLCWLENRQMIHIRISNVTTIITILKYDEYQQCTPQSAPQSNTRMHTDNNDKNEKNKIYATLFGEFWEMYPKRNGRKVGKQNTKKLFNSIPENELSNVIQAVKSYSMSEQSRNGYCRDPERFLKNGYWRDWLQPGEEHKHIPQRHTGVVV